MGQRAWLLGLLASLAVAGGVIAVVLVSHRVTDPELPVASTRAVEALRVEWGGCVRVQGDGPTCVFDSGAPLRLWVEHPDAAGVRVAVDGSPVATERYAIDEQPGLGLRVALPDSARRLQLQIPSVGEPWVLAVESVASRAEVDRAELEAIDDLTQQAWDAFEDPARWGDAKAKTDVAIDRARRAGQWSLAVDIALMATYPLWHRARRPQIAQQVLDDIHATAQRYPRGMAAYASSSGHLHWAMGRLDDAARSYREATRHGLRMEDHERVVEPMSMYAEVLVELGYLGAAAHWSRHTARTLDRFLARRSAEERARWACDRGSVLRTNAWINLLLLQRGHPHQEPVVLYEQAEAIFEPRGECPHPAKLAGTRLGLAETHQYHGESARALEQLVELEGLTLDERMRADDLWLRAALARGHEPRALRAGLGRLVGSAARANTSEARWRVAVRRGDVHERLGEHEAAIAAYRAAEDELDGLVQLAAFGIGRAALGQAHQQGTDRLATLLLDLGRPDEALCALREAAARRAQVLAAPRLPDERRGEIAQRVSAYLRAKQSHEQMLQTDGIPTDEKQRARRQAQVVLRELQQRIDDALRMLGRARRRPSCLELNPRAAGELLLGLYPRGPHGDDWLVVAQDADGTTAHRVLGVDATMGVDQRPTLAGLVLGPLAERVDRAVALRVLATGSARQLDVHTLPWKGELLLARMPVTYGTERPYREPTRWPTSPHAELVADPTGTLPEAEREIETIASRLAVEGWTVHRVPRKSADAEAVRDRLPTADLLHFSGHSGYPDADEHGLWPPYAGGTAGHASHLSLANFGRLTINDIVLCPDVPRVVVLEGCQAGALDTELGGMSLALAFVTAGSHAVIASPERLEDRWAAMLGPRLYDELVESEGFDAARALRRAQHALLTEPERLRDIGRYRVFVP